MFNIQFILINLFQVKLQNYIAAQTVPISVLNLVLFSMFF